MSVFETLNNINVNGHTEKKDKLTYLSWAWAWAEVKKAFPNAAYTIYENPQGRPWFDDGMTGWVKTGVTIEGLEHIEYLPVMDYRNKSIPAAKITSFDANKSIQRSLTKACARHGLGLYIYAGEDLPEGEKTAENEQNASKPKENTSPAEKPQETADFEPNAPITEMQQTLLENLCMMRKLDPAKVFRNWPHLTQEEYGIAQKRLGGMSGNARTA